MSVSEHRLDATLINKTLVQWREEFQPTWNQVESRVKTVSKSCLWGSAFSAAATTYAFFNLRGSARFVFSVMGAGAATAITLLVTGIYYKCKKEFWSDPQFRLNKLLDAQVSILSHGTSLRQIPVLHSELHEKGVINAEHRSVWLEQDLQRLSYTPKYGMITPQQLRNRHGDAMLLASMSTEQRHRFKDSCREYLSNLFYCELIPFVSHATLSSQWKEFLTELGFDEDIEEETLALPYANALVARNLDYQSFHNLIPIETVTQALPDDIVDKVRERFINYARLRLGNKALQSEFAAECKAFGLGRDFLWENVASDWKHLRDGEYPGGWNAFMDLHGQDCLGLLPPHAVISAQNLLHRQIVEEAAQDSACLTKVLARHQKSIDMLDLHVLYSIALEPDLRKVPQKGYSWFREKHFPAGTPLPLLVSTLLQEAFLNMSYREMTKVYADDMRSIGLSMNDVAKRVQHDFTKHAYLGTEGMRLKHGIAPFTDGSIDPSSSIAQKVREELCSELCWYDFQAIQNYEKDFEVLGISERDILAVRWTLLDLRDLLKNEGKAFFERTGPDKMFPTSNWTEKVQQETSGSSVRELLKLSPQLFSSGILNALDYRDQLLKEIENLSFPEVIDLYGWQVFDWGMLRKDDELVIQKLTEHMTAKYFVKGFLPQKDPLWRAAEGLLPAAAQLLISDTVSKWTASEKDHEKASTDAKGYCNVDLLAAEDDAKSHIERAERSLDAARKQKQRLASILKQARINLKTAESVARGIGQRANLLGGLEAEKRSVQWELDERKRALAACQAHCRQLESKGRALMMERARTVDFYRPLKEKKHLAKQCREAIKEGEAASHRLAELARLMSEDEARIKELEAQLLEAKAALAAAEKTAQENHTAFGHLRAGRDTKKKANAVAEIEKKLTSTRAAISQRNAERERLESLQGQLPQQRKSLRIHEDWLVRLEPRRQAYRRDKREDKAHEREVTAAQRNREEAEKQVRSAEERLRSLEGRIADSRSAVNQQGSARSDVERAASHLRETERACEEQEREIGRLCEERDRAKTEQARVVAAEKRRLEKIRDEKLAELASCRSETQAELRSRFVEGLGAKALAHH